jgi:hypothetical protein
MAKRRKAYVHVGRSGVEDLVAKALVHHRHALLELGVEVPARTSAEAVRAAVEILWDHRRWGLSRPQVEGQWVTLCRRVQKGRTSVVFSQPLLADATRDQAALLVDGLAGFEVHVVVTAAPDDRGVADLLETWGSVVHRPHRLHLVPVGADPFTPPAARALWKAFGDVVGFGTASLRLDAVPVLA